MTPDEAKAVSGRSESWLRNHSCSWCDKTLWHALRTGCGAIYDKCEPWQKNFGPSGRMTETPSTESNAK